MGNTITLQELKVDLRQLRDAITIVKGRAGSIRLNVDAVNSAFTAAEGFWHSPAGSSFVQLQQEFSIEMGQLLGLLDEMARRMQATYQYYYKMEQAAIDTIAKNQHNYKHTR